MVYIGCDHGGVELKNKLIDYIEAMGEEVKDLGACTSESVDYPDYGFAVGEAVAEVVVLGEEEDGAACRTRPRQ